MTLRIKVCIGLLAFAISSPQFAAADSVTFVEVDETTNDAWRTSSVDKNDADNIYGTDGYLIASYPNGDPLNLVQPSYATVEVAPGRNYEGVGAEAHQAVFDDVALTGPGPVPDRVAGDYWGGGGADGEEGVFFTVTLNETASFRLTVIGDQTPDNPPGLLWEAARGVRVTGPTSDSG